MNKNSSKINTWKTVVAIFIVILFFFFLFFSSFKKLFEKPVSTSSLPNAAASTPEPVFKKEGELAFIRSGSNDSIAKIDIEIVENESDRNQGLMFRKSMQENRGMLFIFDQPQFLNFWMKNTYIPLDIIFVNEKKGIVSIQKFAKPFSEDRIPSFKNAKYVVEVNGGYCDKYGISEGYLITYLVSADIK